jgi:hypothetical protein
MCFTVSEQLLYLEIQFPKWGKEEIENWRQRTRHPSVPLRLFMKISRISRTYVLCIAVYSLRWLSCLCVLTHALQ